jgi:hypothetical protein
VAVEDEALHPVEHEVAAVPRRNHLDARRIPASRGLGEGEGRDRAAGGDGGEMLLFLLLGAAEQERVRGEADGREERRAQQRRPHLLHEADQLDPAEARAAVRLRHDDGRPAEIRPDPPPHLRVVARLGRHRPAHVGGRGVVAQEGARRRAERLLLGVEREPHAATAAR